VFQAAEIGQGDVVIDVGFGSGVVRQNREGATGRVRMLKDSDGRSKSG
jgi:tRNA A58 N-methylase Trm61